MTPQIERDCYPTAGWLGEMNSKPNLYGIYRNVEHVQLLRVELTDRQRDRETDSQKERKTDTYTDIHRHTNTKRERGRQTDRQR